MRRSGWLERDLVGDTSSHEGATRLWLAAAAKAAARDPRGALFSALAVTGACVFGLPAFLLAIPLTYTLRFAVGLFDRRARRATLRLARAQPITLPSPLSFSDEGAKRLIERLERTRWAIESAVLASPGGAPFALSGLIDDVPQMERDVVVLAARIEYLGRFLSSAPSSTLHAEVLRLDEDREQETDAATRDGVERVIVRCRDHLDTLRLLSARRATCGRMAEEVLRTLEGIPAKIVSLQIARVESCDVRCTDSGRRAETVSEGFTALERTIAALPSGEVGCAG
ncbi:MAG TPA: hypothetical protein VN853_04540 [Polyangia bacterium]|jgi:hypothetical protein|nr:hypothetical protein [Polyangia bacterium]